MFVIKHDKVACIGCGSCAAICPNNWEMTSEGKSNPIEINLDVVGCNKDAEAACPVGAIKIIETKD